MTLLIIAVPVSTRDQFVLSRSNGPVTAVSGRVVSEAYNRLGFQVNIENFPSERSIMMANNGEVDGEVSRIKGLEGTYSNLIMVPVVVNMFEVMVFTKDVNFTITGWDSLKPYNIGIKRGTKFAEKGTEGMTVQSVPTNRQLFLMLNLGRIDVAVTARTAGLFELKQLQLQGIHVLEPPLIKMKLYHYVHWKHRSVIPALTGVLQNMEAEGRIEELRQQAITELFE